MRAILSHRGRTYKNVTVMDIHDETDEQIVDLALKTANETRSSLFDLRLHRWDSRGAVVTLHTD